MIALSINNWNENRKIRNTEQQYLHTLKEKFSFNKVELEKIMNRNSINAENAIKFINIMGPESPQITEDEFSFLLSGSLSYEVQFDPNQGVLDEIISSGKLGLFSNDELKFALSSWKGLLQKARLQEKELQRLRYLTIDIARNNSNLRKGLGPFIENWGITPSKFKKGSLNLLQSLPFEGHMMGIATMSLSLNIRKQLLTENKFSKYLLYAIGEIVLVMIGILLALQVNNWNEERKTRKIERRMLEELVENLEFNTEILKEWITANRKNNRSSEIIIRALEDKLPYHDSLINHFAKSLYIRKLALISEIGYESLKNVGIEIIRNKQMKKNVVNLFEGSYQVIKSKLDVVTYANNEATKLQSKKFMRKQGHIYEPLDYENLYNDLEFISSLNQSRDDRGWLNNSLEDGLEETQIVLQLVKDEINK